MSSPALLTQLEAAARERGPLAYVITVGEDGAPHVVQADVQVSGTLVLALVGKRTAANARSHGRVSLLFPPRHDDDRSLIIDGVAAVDATEDDRGGCASPRPGPCCTGPSPRPIRPARRAGRTASRSR